MLKKYILFSLLASSSFINASDVYSDLENEVVEVCQNTQECILLSPEKCAEFANSLSPSEQAVIAKGVQVFHDRIAAACSDEAVVEMDELLAEYGYSAIISLSIYLQIRQAEQMQESFGADEMIELAD